MTTRFVLILLMSTFCFADAIADKPGDETIDAATAKKQAINWIDKYRKDQVLFHEKDIDRVRKDLVDGSDDDALKWWKGTAEIRAALDSAEWKDTQAWLKEFLRVQAIYSDKEVDEFRTQAKEDARRDSPKDFKKMLAEVEEYRRRLAQRSANARELREQKLEVVSAFRQEEAAARAAALAQAAKTPAPNPVQPPVKPRAPRQASAPLINSLDVARWNVMRNFWVW